MTIVKGYVAKATPLMFEHEDGQKSASAYLEFGGWRAKTLELVPIRVASLRTMPGAATVSWVLDSFAAAVEAGVVDDESYLRQLFATQRDFDEFVHVLREDGDILWVNERHFWAFETVTGLGEENLSTYAVIAEALEREAEYRGW